MKTQNKQKTGLGRKTKDKKKQSYLFGVRRNDVRDHVCRVIELLLSSSVLECGRRSKPRTTETRVKSRKFYVALITSGKYGQKTQKQTGMRGGRIQLNSHLTDCSALNSCVELGLSRCRRRSLGRWCRSRRNLRKTHHLWLMTRT